MDNIDGTDAADWEESLRRALRGLRYGSVEIVIHDGRVVQIEKRERVRITGASHRRPDEPGREPGNAGRAHRTTGAAASARAEEIEQ